MIELSKARVPLGIDVLAGKEIGVLRLISGLVNVKLVPLPAMLPGVQIVCHTEDSIIHGRVSSHALKQRGILNWHKLSLVSRSDEVDDTDAAEVALVHRGLHDTVDGGLEQAASQALQCLAKVDNDAMGLVLDPSILSGVMAEHLQGCNGLGKEQGKGAPVGVSRQEDVTILFTLLL